MAPYGVAFLPDKGLLPEEGLDVECDPFALCRSPVGDAAKLTLVAVLGRADTPYTSSIPSKLSPSSSTIPFKY